MSLPQPLPRVLATEVVVPAMRDIVDKYNVARATTLETVTPETATFDNVLKPLAEVENGVQGKFAMIEMLQYGSPCLETQAEYDKARELYIKAQTEWSADGRFFKLLQAARAKDDFNRLDTESQHLLEKELLRYKHAGHGLLGPVQLEEFQRRNSEILQLEREIHQNIAREKGGIWFTLDELDGVPESELAKWKDDIATDDPDNDSQKEKTKGKFVSFSNGGTIAVLTYAHCPETRKKMYLADNLKLGENKPIFEKIIANRARQAHLLKYATYADLKLTERMAMTTKWLKDFLQGLQVALCPLGKAEIEILQRRRLSDLQARGYSIDQKTEQNFPPWEKRYYERLVEQDFEIDKEKIAEYFPLDTTATKMLEIFGSWFGIRFDPIPDNMRTGDVIWHDSIQVYSVWDTKDGEFIGYLYFDLLWRKYKFRGNQAVNLQAGYLRPDGTRKYPANILMCSFPTPTPGTCVLLKHHQIWTLFHEMGHTLHDILSKTEYVRFHGYETTLDFVELPSSFLENWCWKKDVLKKLSCHYTTLDKKYLFEWRKQNPGQSDLPREIPDHWIEKLAEHRYFNRALFHLRQLSISMFDLQIHSLSNEHEIADLDIQKLFYNLRKEIEGFDFSLCNDGFEFVTFNHLTNGYDMCYYGYLCCTAIAQDIVQTYFTNDPYNIETWAKYRKEVLEYGGSHANELEMLTRFLGHPPNMDALVQTLSQAYQRN
ncbi:uncharacterized protein BHQ10_006066 [Talaromyces amestolkiae]|uniref:Peptidase M3A/M3B catalytic domain-containing protein n=1 Tax=Talaromyces amestolkiae TaxID=1196081 RepID=A0A364L2P6_TALAM|nr:uncharacterized protein BHQ10_006066 [Talaromyces amestolkiae]RAO70054.1 hypothetical protein BHQ10_006066 [Talaromyces amestolkiae]